MLAELTQRIAAGELSRDEVATAMTVLLDSTVGDEPKAAFLARARDAVIALKPGGAT